MTIQSPRTVESYEVVTTTTSKQETCPIHGEYTSTTMIFKGRPFGKPSTCTKCRKIEEEKQEKRDQEYVRQQNELYLEQKLHQANIPTKYQQVSFDQYKAQDPNQIKALTMCKKYADEFQEASKLGVNLILCGKTGTGKTHLALSIALQLLKNGYSVNYQDIFLMIDQIRNSEDSESITKKIRRFAKYDLLIIDEVGDQFNTESELRIFNKIIDARYTDYKPTILISNLPWANSTKTLREVLGPRIRSRLSENSGRIIAFNWDDYRQQTKCNFWS